MKLVDKRMADSSSVIICSKELPDEDFMLKKAT